MFQHLIKVNNICLNSYGLDDKDDEFILSLIEGKHPKDYNDHPKSFLYEVCFIK